MKTLADAWNWYKATKKNLARMQRFGKKHWGNLPDSVWQDDHFRSLESSEVVAETIAGLQPIDDLAVLVLFSVFESQVRDYLVELIKPEAEKITDPILKKAAEVAIAGVKDGSFYGNVLEPLKKKISDDNITQVNQIRDFRNWVAHGRPERRPDNNVSPQMAFDRLREFLGTLGIASQGEEQISMLPGSRE